MIAQDVVFKRDFPKTSRIREGPIILLYTLASCDEGLT